MQVYIGSDHAGVGAKEEIMKVLKSLKIKYLDMGPDSHVAVDYPIYAKKVCEEVQRDLGNSFGILICGSGTGMSMVANRFKGIRAAFAYDEYGAKMARVDNDANVLTLRAREFDHKKYKKIVKTFLETKFSHIERHVNRIKLIE